MQEEEEEDEEGRRGGRGAQGQRERLGGAKAGEKAGTCKEFEAEKKARGKRL